MLAYARYLPPAQRWSSKFGLVCSFDEVVDAMLEKPSTSSCAGTHAVQALTFMLRIHESGSPLFGESTRHRTRSFLRDCVVAAASTQRDDGAWSPDWRASGDSRRFRQTAGSTATSTLVLVTGHVVEWLLYLPRDLAPPPSVLSRARRWLVGELARATVDQVCADPCPYSHGLLVLELIAHGGTVEAP